MTRSTTSTLPGQPFLFEGRNVTSAENADADFLSSEVHVIGARIRKIAQRLRHNGPIKMVHRDSKCTVAYQFSPDGTEGHGSFIYDSQVSDLALLNNL